MVGHCGRKRTFGDRDARPLLRYVRKNIRATISRVREKVYAGRDRTVSKNSPLRTTERGILWSVEGVIEVREVDQLQVRDMENGERDDTTSGNPGHMDSLLCDTLHGSMHDRDNSPMMRAVFRSPVCKVYRFQTESSRWMLVREQMSDSPLTSSLPKQLLSCYIQEDRRRIQELRDLGDLSPHWEVLRSDVIAHYSHLISTYKETLTELNKLTGSSASFKSSCNKTDRHLEFIPVNLHTQRMQVTCPRTTAWYDVVTVGAPSDHYQGFKHGGLQRLLNKPDSDKKSSPVYRSIFYSSDQSSRAREILSSVTQLQPLISGLAEELLQAALEVSPQRVQETLTKLAHRTEQMVHALKDELVKSALLALHKARPAYLLSDEHAHATHSNGPGHQPLSTNQDGLYSSLRRQDSLPQHSTYNEDEWDRVWANVAMSLNCIIAMVDRLQKKENRKQELTSQTRNDVLITPADPSPWHEHLLPLVITLRECVCEAVDRARSAMTFVLLQGAATQASQGLAVTHRRDAVFSQALCAVVCGFALRIYAGVEDKPFLLQLCEVGLVAQFEGLLSTYGDEIGMLEDMEVGVSDLKRISFRITEAKSEQPADLLPTVSGQRGGFCVEVPLPSETYLLLPGELRDGRGLRVHPLLFNIGINQQQSLAERFGDSSLQERINQRSCEMLKSYYSTLREKLPNLTLPSSLSQSTVDDLLTSLDQSLEMKKRKNVEVLWLAASICRRLNGIRLTSCKSAKDRTSMSVTLEQCTLLREEHTLNAELFNKALDCMRREGCRLENVEKNIGSRKYAFNSIQLKTFPKPYRPPEGTYGKVDT
ncbi:type II inositol 3,4-bisphosphate 4-phosphatase isoform X2 [Esox lucius]|uniref:type II inositol 3,4-bisphosphate 4-phosphatase isoform X2 n=1 Tax=Esox lucius TaxID=8010 RepID=UPI0010BDFAAA|nr:type II inositol 3,4-bisphosphate 4-phosphatase isoform X2 [Esox lucius]